MIQNLSDRDLELLSQYLDGELPAQDSRTLELRLRREPQLGAALVRLQELNQRLRDALAEHDRIPGGIVEMLDQNSLPEQSRVEQEAAPGSAQVLPFPGAASLPRSRPQPSWVFAAAASVTLAVAVLIGTQLNAPSSSNLPGNDKLVSIALDTQLSGDSWSALPDGRELQTVLSFPHENGGWCREYLLRGGDADWRAVACREGDRWVTKAAGLESYLESTDMYRPAGAGDNENVAVFISQHAADIALGREQEQALVSSQWR